jgi:hypothetical protein
VATSRGKLAEGLTACPGPLLRARRFDDHDKIVERWDVLQVIPGESRNDDGMLQL